MTKNLFDRRVPQLVGVYILASWGFVQFVDWAVEQYALSPALTNLVVTLLLVLLPGVLILAWRHGTPGHDTWTKVDAAVIILNLVVAGGILNLVFSGEELGAATTVALIEDAEGNTVERVIPKAEFRRNVMAFGFDNESGDSELDWISLGLPMMVNFDLIQDMFVYTVTPDHPKVLERLREAGFEGPVGIPLTVKRREAERMSVGHFFDGSVSVDGDTLNVVTRLYDSRTARQVATHTYRGADFFEIVDRISLDLRRDMGIPEWQIETSVDLPIAEIATNSPEAVRAMVAGTDLARQNDIPGAMEAFRRAVEADSTFAIAHLTIGQLGLRAGQQQDAVAAYATANQYSYRLPERVQLLAQTLEQLYVGGDPDGAMRTARYWTEVYPGDPIGHQLLAAIYATRGDADNAIYQYRALLAIDSLDTETMSELAAGFSRLQQYDSALVYYGRMAEIQPGNADTHMGTAGTLIGLQRFDEAREEYERARAAAPREPSVVSQIARLDLRLGRNDDAAVHTAEAVALIRTPAERYTVAGLEESLFYHLGQFAALEDAYRRRLAAAEEQFAALGLAQRMPGSEYLVYAADVGRQAEALRELDRLSGLVQAPWSSFPAYTSVRVHLASRDLDAAIADRARIQALAERLGSAPGRMARLAWIDGRIAALEDGNCERALAKYDEARELLPRIMRYAYWRADCLTQLGRFDEAEEEIDWILARYPGWPTYQVLAARFYADASRTDEAIAQLERAVETWSEADPDFRPAIEARAMLAELRGG